MRNVPAPILVKYSHLFRIVTNTGSFKGPFHCTNLIELYTAYGQEWSRELLVKNPGLKRLVWGGPYHCRIETLEQQQELVLEMKALMHLENLDALSTSGFSLGEGLFVKVLRNNASRLSNLTLSTVDGVTSIDGLELPYLTELHIKFGGTESPVLIDLVRCCPILQKLSLAGSRSKSLGGIGHHGVTTNINNSNNGNGNGNNNNDPTTATSSPLGFQIQRLAQNIAECCPELSSIRITSNAPKAYFVDDQECAILVNACRKLESFSTAILTLDHGLTEALVNQRHTLKSLSLMFLDTVEEDLRARISHVKEIHCLQRLKASLPRLEDLTLSMDQDFWRTWLAQDLGITSYYTRGASGLRDGVIAYLKEPWACLDLRTLSLKGFPLGSAKDLITASGESSSSPSSSTPVAASAPNSSRVLSPSSTMASWQPVKDPSENNPAGEDVMAQNFQLLNIASLTKLKNLSLNQNSYERIPTWV
ncbi:hypothetical protein BGX31_011507 [Mortierella sp. GBA43]|nr:hypothetical protein BGX31_011507 [Mortierella sp. GBA43]